MFISKENEMERMGGPGGGVLIPECGGGEVKGLASGEVTNTD